MACKYIYNNITYKSKEEFIEKVVLQEFPTLAGGRYAGAEDGMEFERITGLPSDLKGNQFLGLLAKDNNWVTFFIKSIIADSAKKGYEKVLFPLGDTASKIEGHTTLEEFKKQKEDRIKELEKQSENPKYKIKVISTGNYRNGIYNSKEEAQNFMQSDAADFYLKKNPNEFEIVDFEKENRENELNQLKQELERVETEGFAALKPIYNFYENTVTNILKKQGYNPKKVTDEFGNSWNEIEITGKYNEPLILDSSIGDLEEALKQASVNQTKFEAQIERLLEESGRVEKVINKIDEASIRSKLRDAIRYMKDNKKELKNFVYFLLEAEETLKFYNENLRKIEGLPIDQAITQLSAAEVISKSFRDIITFLKKDFRFTDDNNQFKQLVNSLSSYYDQIQTVYTAQAEVLALDLLTQELEPDAKIAFDSLTKDLRNLEDQIAKARAAGAKEKYIDTLLDRAETTRKRMVALVPNREMIEETMKGLRGDLNWFTANLRSTIAMGDPILSGYARRLKSKLNKIREVMMPIKDSAQTQMADYMKRTGKNPRSSMASFYEGLYELGEIDSYDKDGVKKEQYYSLLSPITSAFSNDEKAFRERRKKALESGNQEELIKVEAEFDAWLNKYTERRYSEAWYSRFNLLTPEAAKARKEILDEIKFKTRGNRDDLTDADYERIADLRYDLNRLTSSYTDDGKLKTGKDLEIAKSIQAFNKKTAEMSRMVVTDENRKWFDIIVNKKKQQVQDGLLSQEQFDRWYYNNTQREISQEFYNKRQTIIDKINLITSKLPKDQFKESTKDLWAKLFDISKPYRDEDNIINGTEFNTDETDIVRQTEEAIEEIKAKIIKFSGLTIEEEKELSGLWGALETLTPEELDRFNELKERKNDYKNFLAGFVTEAEVNALITYFAELSALSKWEPTLYYNKIYNDKLHEFRIQIDPNMLLDLTQVEERFKNQSEWFKNNHIAKLKKEFVDGRTVFLEVNEPLYIWRNIIPTNPDWITDEAPGYAFRTRIVNPEETNQAYKNLNYDYYRNIDDNDLQIVPKRIINDNGKVKLSPYMNESYERLREDDTEVGRAQFSMLQYLTDIHLAGQKILPKYKRLGYFLPGTVKGDYDRFAEQGIRGFGKAVKEKFVKTQTDVDEVLGDTTQIDLSIIPVKYSTKVRPEDQDLDLLGGILKHRYGVEEFKILDEELPYANVIKSSLKTGQTDISQNQINKSLEKLGFKKFIKPTKESQRSKSFEGFVRMMFYGETEIAPFNNATINKALGNIFAISSLQVMTFNFPAHLTNILSGEVQNVIEAAGGKYMTFKDYGKAKSIYMSNFINFWNDYTKEGNKSFWSVFADKFDIPGGEFEDMVGDKIAYSRLRDLQNHVMFIKQGGEHEIQISTMIAMALNHKVKLNGAYVSLDKALELKDGKLVIKEGAELTEADLTKFQNRVHGVLRQLNGAYSKFDKSQAERTFLGKLAFFMRKFFLPMAYRRFEPYKYDYEEQDFKEGYYITAFKILKDVVRLNTNMVKNWDTYRNSLTPIEKTNLRRFAAEMTIIAALGFTILLLGGYDDDRDLKGRWLYSFVLYELMKLKSETETFLPLPGFGLNEITSLYSSPFVSSTTMKTGDRLAKDVLNFVLQNEDAYFKQDSGIWEEGDLRLKSSALKLAGFGPLMNMMTPEVLIRNFELRNR